MRELKITDCKVDNCTIDGCNTIYGHFSDEIYYFFRVKGEQPLNSKMSFPLYLIVREMYTEKEIATFMINRSSDFDLVKSIAFSYSLIWNNSKNY
jgi:hypothetical protein